MDPDPLLERFLRYVRIDTTADPAATDYPSSPGQWELGKLLAEELEALGVSEVRQDEFGIVHGLVPATVTKAPTIVLNAHLDTSPETSGCNVNPQVISNYGGGDIVLPADPRQIIRVAESPELNELLGKTLITTDGTTLLGGDDKAGIAVIMEAVSRLKADLTIPHGPVRILFTCDEEIGHGVDHVDVAALQATACYTLDGPGAGTIDNETFSANLATITIVGQNIHPALAKGRMVNAVRVAAFLVDQLPRSELSPESTEHRQGFLHPYELQANVGEATIRILLRDFETPRLEQFATNLKRLAGRTESEFPGSAVTVSIRAQYRNLAEGLAREPRAVSLAETAFRRLGLPCQTSIIRGGTDGSRLTELGLPTPNLSTGQHNLHSKLEWVCLDEMRQAAAVLLELLRVWAEETQARGR